jgi:hypothetical protein
MAMVAMICGGILVVLGLGAYFGADRESITALIPTFFGLPLLLLGYLGRAENRRKHALHAATVIALLGLLGSLRGAPQFGRLLAGTEIARPVAAVVQTGMALVCLVFLVLAIRSFVNARRGSAAPPAG